MVNTKLFGTDGIRGEANVYPMTAAVALKLGMAIGQTFQNSFKGKTQIIVGKDTRLSGYMLEYALVSGIVSMGADAILVGPMPTPAIAHLTKSFAADAGVVISASHNPYQDNGFKVFDSFGFKISESYISRLENLIFDNDFKVSDYSGKRIGKARRIDDASGRYIEFAKSSIQNRSLKGLKVVLDCANGAAYKIGPLIFSELGADVIVMNNFPNGININANSGALYPEKTLEKVVRTKSDLGIALDGDADRIILVDSNGEIVDGDEILGICAKYFFDHHILKNKVVVATSLSNFGLEEMLNNFDVKLLRTEVGDRYVAEAMRDNDAILGGEQSGHIIFSDYATTGDGIIAGLQILSIMQNTKISLCDLKKGMVKYPQEFINVKVKEKRPFDEMPHLKRLIDDSNFELGNKGRVLVRYSGTENKCRVMVEGKDNFQIKTIAINIADVIKKEIGI